MSRGAWLNGALLVAVVALGLIAYLRPATEESRHKLSAIAAADVKRIKLELAGAEAVEAERVDDGWRITAPFAARADPTQMQRLLSLLDASSRDLFPAQGLARYGLSEPHTRVTFNRETISFGAVNEMSREQYVQTAAGVLLVPLQHAASLPRQPLQLASKQLFSSEEAPIAFEFAQFRLTQMDGKWQLTPAAEVSADDMQRWVDEWRLAQALEVRIPSATKPLSTAKLRLKSGAEITLSAMVDGTQLTLARSDQKLEYVFHEALAKRLLFPPAGTPVKSDDANAATQAK